MLTLLLALSARAEAPTYDRVLHDARPVSSSAVTYPKVAKSLQLPPVPCEVQLYVGTDGKVFEVLPTKCPGVFAEAARKDIMTWRYTPAVVEGQPIVFMSPIRVTYTLPEQYDREITDKSWERIDATLQRRQSSNRVVGFAGIALIAGGGVVAALAGAGQVGGEEAQVPLLATGGGVAGLGVALTVAGFSASGRNRTKWELWQEFEP